MQLFPSDSRLKIPIFLAVLATGIVVAMGSIFYVHGSSVMKQKLAEQLRSSAAMAAMQFDGDALENIRGPQDIDSPVFLKTVARLGAIRNAIPNIEYAYLMRRTDDPHLLSFIADADSLLPDEEADENENGVIDPEETLSLPGDLYDISDAPVMQHEAFIAPAVDEDFTYDQWGAFISGYAPIFNSRREAVAILGLDMEAGDYVRLSRSIFSGVSLALFLLLAIMLMVSVVLFSWHNRLETMREVDKERSALVALAMHQLGTPLSIFRWWVEILEDRYGNEICEETDACIQMEEGINRLEDVFNDLKEAHDVSQGNLEYTYSEASLRDIVEKVVSSSGKRLESRKQSVRIHIPEDIVLKLDSKLITGVIEELLENAITYSPVQAVATVSVERKGGDAIVSVQDEGCGIPKSDMPNVFKKFVRGAKAQKFKAVGNGLGLFIAKGIIEEAGGKIWIESEEGKGTTVSFSLPISGKKKSRFR